MKYLIVSAYLRDHKKHLGCDVEGVIFKFYTENVADLYNLVLNVHPPSAGLCYMFDFPELSLTGECNVHTAILKILKPSQLHFELRGYEGFFNKNGTITPGFVVIQMKKCRTFVYLTIRKRGKPVINSYLKLRSTEPVLSVSCVSRSPNNFEVLSYSIGNS